MREECLPAAKRRVSDDARSGTWLEFCPSLVLRSARYLRWPSEDYRRHLLDHRHAFGFLSPGDRVSGWITGLGRQNWEVRP